jgi:hypothetical protein
MLEQQRREVRSLLDRLPSRALSRRGLGGGEWSPVDLIGHLESWEEHALRAIDAWSHGSVAPINREVRRIGVNSVNAAEVERKAGRSAAAASASAAATFERLLLTIGAISDDRWEAPPTARSRRTLGERVGSILGGPGGGFTHDQAHLPSLREFVERFGR